MQHLKKPAKSSREAFLATTNGLAAMDALHLAAARSVAAEEFVTTEKSTKPMHQVTEIRVISIASE